MIFTYLHCFLRWFLTKWDDFFLGKVGNLESGDTYFFHLKHAVKTRWKKQLILGDFIYLKKQKGYIVVRTLLNFIKPPPDRLLLGDFNHHWFRDRFFHQKHMVISLIDDGCLMNVGGQKKTYAGLHLGSSSMMDPFLTNTLW